MLEPGWLAKQLDRVREESKKLPSWMQYAPKQEKAQGESKTKPPAKTAGTQTTKRG